jgi:hypothetical protein
VAVVQEQIQALARAELAAAEAAVAILHRQHKLELQTLAAVVVVVVDSRAPALVLLVSRAGLQL